jgi:hypothetical protein
MKSILALGMLLVAGTAQMVPSTSTPVTPVPAASKSTYGKAVNYATNSAEKAYGYASDQAGKISKSVGKVFKRREKTQLTASQYPFYTVQSTSVVNPGEGQFKSPMLTTIQ